MKTGPEKAGYRSGFSLAEVIVTVTIGAMVLVTMLSVYNRAERSAETIQRNLSGGRLPNEVLQRIAEDLDAVRSSGAATKIVLANRMVRGYPGATLQIIKTIQDGKNAQKEFETIIWQSGYDYESDVNGLVLYRMHTGLLLEDKLLDERRQDLEKLYPWIPICKGVTYFKVLVPQEDKFMDRWAGASLPKGVVVSISFAEPYVSLDGTVDVPPEAKFTRAIAIDRSRGIGFAVSVDSNGVDSGDKEGDKESADERKDSNEASAETPDIKTGPDSGRPNPPSKPLNSKSGTSSGTPKVPYKPKFPGPKKQ